MFLVTTALREFWPESGPIWLMSSGCVPDTEDSGITDKWQIDGTVGDPFQSEPEAAEAYAEIRRIADKLIEILAPRLNTLHGTSHPEHYWRIHIGIWTLFFVTMVYDRHARLLKATMELGQIEVVGCRNAVPVIVPDTLNFVYEASGDLYNCQIYTLLCNKLCIPVVAKSFANGLSKPEIILDAKSPHLKKLVNLAYAFMASFFAQRADVLTVSSGLPRRFELALSLATGGAIFPLHTQSVADKSLCSTINVSARSALSAIQNGCDAVTELALGLVELCLPKAFVEDYQELCSRSDRIYQNYKPKIIYSSNAWWFDETFKHWAAKCQGRGTKLIGGAHGSAYFVRKHCIPEEFEVSLTDYYLTWGWSAPERSGLIPAPACKLVDLDARPNRISGEGILFGGTVEARHNVLPVVNFAEYLDWQRRFFTAVSPALIGKFLVRLHYADYGWKMKKRLLRVAPSLRFDNWDKSFKSRLNSCRLYVCDHLSSTYAEALAANVPVVLFWNEAKYPINQNAMPHIQALKDCHILHDTPESAASWVAKVYEDPASWWLSDSCQKAVKDFCFLYARTSEAPLKEWQQIFDTLLKAR